MFRHKLRHKLRLKFRHNFRSLVLTPCLEACSRAQSEIEIDLKCIFGPGCNGAEGEAPLELQSFHQLPIIFTKLLFCSWFYQNYEMHLSPCLVQKGRKKSPWHFATCIKRLCSTTMAIFNLLFEILCIILSWMGIYKLPLFLSFFLFYWKQ